MTETWQDLARAALEGAQANSMTFPESVHLLMAAGFDSYAVDFRRSTRIYYRPDGATLEFESAPSAGPVADCFDAARVRAAIREAQDEVPDYTYKSFCAKVMAAGCAGYLVSFPGRRVLYYGRTGETHTEHFPAP